MQLCRIVRMTVTAGFLREPEPGHVAHSALSAPFVTSPTLLDAAMFLSETMAPAALQMAVATQHYENLQRSKETASNVAFITPATFTSAYEQRPKLRRQWSAYLQHVTDDPYASVMDVLTCLDWHSLGNATVVEVSPLTPDIVFLPSRKFRVTVCFRPYSVARSQLRRRSSLLVSTRRSASLSR